jgi:hypothetical protein
VQFDGLAPAHEDDELIQVFSLIKPSVSFILTVQLSPELLGIATNASDKPYKFGLYKILPLSTFGCKASHEY